MWNLRRVRCTVAILSTSLVLTSAAAAAAAVQIPVKNTPAFEQVPGTGGGTYFAWTRGRLARLFIQSGPGQPATRVNGLHNAAWAGNIDGTTLVFQQAGFRKSNVRFYDVVTHARSAPTGINTPEWEWHPTMSGDWILFGRQVLAQHRSLVLLHNTSTDDTITLADVRGAGTIAHPGQVSGNWAVWDRCTAHRVCDVYRYDIAGDVKEKIPNTLTGRDQYFPSVTTAGTVYFVHSGDRCGQHVKLVEWTGGPSPTILASFGLGRDVFSTTQTVPDQNVGTDVYFDKYTCRAGTADIFKIIVP